VHAAQYTGEDCNGCGACFYCCPEPGAITVERLTPPAKTAAPAVPPKQEVNHAAAL
jgi:Fe-S-cluster-containing hydrogenase component 2